MTGGHLRPKVTKVGEAKTGKALMDNTAENNRTAKAEEENNIAVAKAKTRMNNGKIAKNNGNTKAKIRITMDNTAENDRTAKAEEENNNIAVAKAKIRSDGTAKNNGNAKAKDTRTNEEDTMINDGTLGGHRPVRSAAVTRAATSIQGTTNDRTGQAGNVSLGEGGRRALEKY